MKKKIIVFILICAFSLTAVSCKSKSIDNNYEEIPDSVATYDGYDMNEGIDLNSAKMNIVQSNTSNYVVAIPDNASNTITYAANELVYFIEQSTGIDLLIEKESNVSGDKYISIGKTKFFDATNLVLDEQEYNYDGFIIKTYGNSIIIKGCNERGSLYGVYDFLERFVGIKFFTPDDIYVDQLTEISVNQMNIKEVPVFRQRNYYNRYMKHFTQFEARTRMISDITTYDSLLDYKSDWYQGVNTIHNIMDYVPKSEYYDEHPEFYASYSHSVGALDDICYTNGITADGEIDETMDISAAKAVLKTLEKFATEDETAKFFQIGMADNRSGYCECDKCKESNELNGGRSGTVVIFMNAIARAIKEWAAEKYPEGREINIVFFAYIWLQPAPVVVDENGVYQPANDNVILEDNVFVRLAVIDANYAYSFTDEKQDLEERQLFAAWSVVADNIMMWDYTTYYGGYLWYFPSLNYLADNIKFYKSINVVYLLNQSAWNTDGHWQSILNFYVASKLYWHPDRNVSELVNEFITYYNGAAAAPYIKNFMQMMEDKYAMLKNIENFRLQATRWFNTNEYFSATFLENCMAELNKGIEAIQNDTSLTEEQKAEYNKRIVSVMLIPQYMILYSYDNYYSSGKKEFAESFEQNAILAGFTMITEETSLVSYLASLGLS